MSAQAFFSHQGDGHAYSPTVELIWNLPTGQQAAATAVWSAICLRTRQGSTELRITDSMLLRSPSLRGRSLQFLRKGLKALTDLGMIDRERRRGLRTIFVVGRIKGRTRPVPKVAKPLPAPAVIKMPEKLKPLAPEELQEVRAYIRDMHLSPRT